MKTLLLGLGLAAVGVSSANAQVYVPQTVANGAVLGGIAGAIVGGHNNDRWGQGGLIGAAIGALLGAGVEQGRQADQVYGQQQQMSPYGYPVYAPPAVGPAPTVPAAPVYGEPVYTSQAPQQVYTTQAPQPVYTYPQEQVQQQPQVVYVERPAPPAVVYVNPWPSVVYYGRPSVRYYPQVRYSPPPRSRGGWGRR